MRVIGILLDTIMLFPPLALPLAVAVVGEIVFFWLMTRSPEDQERLLFSVVLLPVHALTFVMMVYCVFDPKMASATAIPVSYDGDQQSRNLDRRSWLMSAMNTSIGYLYPRD